MFRCVPFFFIAGVLLEIASLIWVGRQVGVLATLLLIILGGATGAALVRRSGLGMIEGLRASQQSSGTPVIEVGSALLLLASGLLFISPGFFSDALGGLLLLPPVRTWIAGRLSRPFNGSTSGRPSRPSSAVIIEGEAFEVGADGVLPANGDRQDP